MTARKPGTAYPSETLAARKARGYVRISLDLTKAELAMLDRLRAHSSRGIYLGYLLAKASAEGVTG